MRTVLNDIDKRTLEKRVKDLEDRGFKVKTPITSKGIKRGQETFYAVMEKE